MAVFETDILIRFAHCDPAGIVFYPRYFEMVNQTVEDWFAGPLQRSFRELHDHYGVSVPTGRMEADFHRPSRLGEVVRFSLQVERIGRSSADLLIRAVCGEEARATYRLVLVFVHLATLRSKPWADDLRARMETFLIPETPA
jgi:4-hydroxybenzoyl-CoA thioesterase